MEREEHRFDFEICSFTYRRDRDHQTGTTIGVETSWEELKVLYNRAGDGFPNGTHYRTISEFGPELFAVSNWGMCFYHDGCYNNSDHIGPKQGRWRPYITARDTVFGRMDPLSGRIWLYDREDDDDPGENESSSDNSLYQSGQSTKEVRRYLSSQSNAYINQMICYYLTLLKLVQFISQVAFLLLAERYI
ncbi:unnamed protein product [Didymodactylos carnosus]|uniref:Uncharacterized protein n=1 Tax=Didymodactylos carnosus TaxID=1234261 RepID=A0A814K028_9BILA|nr:unnamed protein product [Didymodactylos carnosus]CAF1086915.1 unnamed protein product [Didymodactylos carnosus]CAF3814826.1 unnamed protein product [Didymodactylos carnosus]CAF3849246.1 unnamed protein product [Didymodactylos carnosus]